MRFVLEWLAGAGGFGGMMVARTMVQYLPWTIGHQPTRDVEAVLDQIEQALGRL